MARSYEFGCSHLTQKRIHPILPVPKREFLYPKGLNHGVGDGASSMLEGQ